MGARGVPGRMVQGRRSAGFGATQANGAAISRSRNSLIIQRLKNLGFGFDGSWINFSRKKLRTLKFFLAPDHTIVYHKHRMPSRHCVPDVRVLRKVPLPNTRIPRPAGGLQNDRYVWQRSACATNEASEPVLAAAGYRKLSLDYSHPRCSDVPFGGGWWYYSVQHALHIRYSAEAS
jgi:hypothetical protein